MKLKRDWAFVPMFFFAVAVVMFAAWLFIACAKDVKETVPMEVRPLAESFGIQFRANMKVSLQGWRLNQMTIVNFAAQLVAVAMAVSLLLREKSLTPLWRRVLIAGGTLMVAGALVTLLRTPPYGDGHNLTIAQAPWMSYVLNGAGLLGVFATVIAALRSANKTTIIGWSCLLAYTLMVFLGYEICLLYVRLTANIDPLYRPSGYYRNATRIFPRYWYWFTSLFAAVGSFLWARGQKGNGKA